MASIKYIVRGQKENSNIYVRLYEGRQIDFTVSTGYTINPKFWSSTGKVKQTAENKEKLNLSNKLEGLKRSLIDRLNKDKGSSTTIDKEWLKNAVTLFKNPMLETESDYLIDAIKSYQSELKNRINKSTGKLISSGTIRNYSTTISRLNKYESDTIKKIRLIDVDLTFHSDYGKYATNTLNLSINSIARDFKHIKTICIDAKDKGKKINQQVESRKFNAPTEPTLFVTLNEQEIEKITNVKLPSASYLSNARDWLIIGCWTGCRVNDLMKLSNDNIYTRTDGKRFIRYTQGKTGKQVDLPIHPSVHSIINRLNGFPRPISDVKFNKYIKEVCKQSGIVQRVKGSRQNPITHKKEVGMFEKYELIRSHTCRRSFATNHYDKLSNKIIMAVTGHATEKMLLNYIGEVENNHLDDFIDVWQQNEENRKNVIKINQSGS